jgi:hypothetical protein
MRGRVHRDEHVITVECETATEFLDLLDPRHGYFRPASMTLGAIFRGVKHDKYPLRPTAFRPHSRLLYRQRSVAAPLPTHVTQCAAEVQTLRSFFEIVAREGIRLAEDSPTLRSSLQWWDEILAQDTLISLRSPEVWPPPNLWSLLAIAQHYGVPTRALDWTRSALVAAYFASAGSTTRQCNIAVWAYTHYADRLERAIRRFEWQPDPIHNLVIFSAPEADNPNLMAQRGMFMLYRQTLYETAQTFDVIDYDKLFVQDYAAVSAHATFYKITVPARESSMIRAMLAATGVTAATLFPGLAGAARELREEQRLADLKIRIPSNGASEELQAELMRIAV